MSRFYEETSRQIPIYDVCDILIVGSGSAGHSAAIAAARAGAKNIILMERYGYSGGDVTGGLVLMVPNLSWYNKSFVRGLQEEWFTRLEKVGPECVVGPSLSDIGSTDPAKINRWKTYMDCTSKSEPKRLVRSVYFDGEQLKIELDKMLMEHKDSIRVLYHSWGTRPIMEGNVCKGVFFESKEGRQAVLAKVVIDATGDGDLFRQTGTPYEAMSDPMTRGRVTTLAWRIGGVDSWAYNEWRQNHPDVAMSMRESISKIAGNYRCFGPSAAVHGPYGVHIVTNFHPDRNCANVKDLTETEINTRVTIREIIAYLKEVCPIAFKDAYLYDIAPQTGVRCSYRLQGEYIMTPYDFAFATKFDDVIAWHSTVCEINDCGPVEIPYRVIVPKGVENMLCPGRHLSADSVAIDWLNLIPQCIGTGQAAGVAAHVAISDGVNVRDVDIKKVQDILVCEQDVPLPRHPNTDRSYQECCEEHQYGLYTDLAKKAHENPEEFEKYRQSGIGGWEAYLKSVKQGSAH